MVMWYVIMGVALLAMIWCAKNQKRVKNAQLYSIICLVVVAVSAISVLMSFFGDADIERSIANANQFELAKVNALADYVSKKFAGKNVAILLRSDMESTGDQGVNRAKEFKDRVKGVKVVLTETIEVPNPNDQMSPDAPPVMLEEVLNAKKFNAAFENCRKAKADVIVNFAGLPMMPDESRKLKIWDWTQVNAPKIVFYDMNELGMVALPQDFDITKKGMIAATVVSKPDINFNYLEDKAPSDLKEAFQLRFVIMDASNIQELIKNNAVYFEGPQK